MQQTNEISKYQNQTAPSVTMPTKAIELVNAEVLPNNL